MTTVGSMVEDPRSATARTLPEMLWHHASVRPDVTAFVALVDGEEPGETMSYGELDRAARARARLLRERGLGGADTPGVTLLYPSGLEFVRSLLGCMYANVPGAPVQVPTRERSLARMRGIVDDAGSRVVLTTERIRAELLAQFADSPALAGLELVATDALSAEESAAGWEGVAPRPEDVALLQYTSGSTAAPKGVRVSHANFLSNVWETELVWPSAPEARFVSWIPHFHDMGMLFGVVMPLWTGSPSYLMAPQAFIRRPRRWLEAMSRFGGTHAAAPSFAYEMCVREVEQNGLGGDLDLSKWRVAANGAEPVRWAVVERFARTFAPAGFPSRAMCPGYGLAENTLKATGSPWNAEPHALWVEAEALNDSVVRVVSPGSAGAVPLVSNGVVAGESRVRIVDPESAVPAEPGRVGEIWISGPCVADGYWRRESESGESFRARVMGEDTSETYLRTGDLGFLHGGELYIAGRLKDVIIRKGRNFYPQDLELSVEGAVPGLHPNCAAAFSVEDGTAERLVVVVEADGRALRGTSPETLRERVREAVHDGQRLHVDDVVVVRRGSVPKTSSGKVQRRACRAQYLAGELVVVASAGRVG